MKEVFCLKLFDNCSGQSTIEFAVVFAGFLSMVLALGVLWDFLSGGQIVEHAIEAASHSVTNVVPQVVSDVFLY